MKTVSEVMHALKRKGSAQTCRTFARHGIDLPMHGVKVGDLKSIAKKIKGNQELALELFETGNYDAMYLAGIVVDGAKMSKKQIDDWAKSAGCEAISAYIVPWVATESPHARELALKWMKSKSPAIASSGWCTYAGIVATTPDEELNLDEIKGLLAMVVKTIHDAPNKVRYVMNAFVISVGSYVKPLLKEAKQAAKTIGKVDVDMGDTACKVPDATAYIAKIESMGRVGKKRKTMRC
jgi:3-methyladenine DNA glycosylase AlkD